MNAKSGLLSLIAMLAMALSACAYDPAQVARDKDREISELRREVEQVRLQGRAKDDEARKLEAKLAEAKKLEAQVAGLQDRLKVMDDMMMSKSEDIARLEAQLEAEKEAAAAAAAKGKGKKGRSGVKAPAPPKEKDAPSAPVDIPAKPPAADAKP